MEKIIKPIAYALLGLLFWAVLVNVAKPKTQTDTQVTTPKDQLLMEWRDVVATGVNNDEKDRIVLFVDTFERAIAQKDRDKVLSFFTDPETKAEQDELDFILWRDVDPTGKQDSSRLFTTAGYNFNLTAHYTREVRKAGARVQVIVDELRVIPSGGEWAGYSAQVSRLAVELRESSHGYEIVRYYHQEPASNRDLKYKGFIAE